MNKKWVLIISVSVASLTILSFVIKNAPKNKKILNEYLRPKPIPAPATTTEEGRPYTHRRIIKEFEEEAKKAEEARKTEEARKAEKEEHYKTSRRYRREMYQEEAKKAEEAEKAKKLNQSK